MGSDHRLSIGVTLYHVDLCTRLEICLQIYVGADFSHWSIHVLVCPSFHLIIPFINIFF